MRANLVLAGKTSDVHGVSTFRFHNGTCSVRIPTRLVPPTAAGDCVDAEIRFSKKEKPLIRTYDFVMRGMVTGPREMRFGGLLCECPVKSSYKVGDQVYLGMTFFCRDLKKNSSETKE